MTIVKLFLAAVAFAFLAACTSKPIYNVSDAPSATTRKASLEEVNKAIVRAGTQLGWKMATVNPGHIVGTLSLRDHTAIVDVKYNAKTYSINYKDSNNLNYQGGTIHRNYNSWVQNLDRAIQVQLSSL